MEGAEEVGLVLSRASELRLRIDKCILENAFERQRKDRLENGEEAEKKEGTFDDDAEQEEENLIDVRDALEALEHQLSSLQALEQQQIYEKEAALAQIDRCRVFLQSKIREYQGGSEVIAELSKFAGGSAEEEEDGDGDSSGDLLLPPYSGLVPEAIFLEGLSSSRHLPKTRKLVLSNGLVKKPTSMAAKKARPEADSLGRRLVKGAGSLLGLAAKSAVMIVGALAVLGLAGFEPRLVRRGGRLEPSELVSSHRCPPGRVMVVQDGEARCVVKERVEVPFGSVNPTPVVSLGLG
ncbi:plastid division2 [Wolffia australiana]